MSGTTVPLGKRVFSNTLFSLFDLFLEKLGNTVVFVLLVRLLAERDIAAIGVAGGYLVLVVYLDVGPIRMLLRDYPKFAADRRERDLLLTALFAFWCLEAIAVLLISVLLRAFVFPKMLMPGLPLLFLGMSVDLLGLILQDWIKTVFYADFRQPEATKISFFLSLVRLACYGTLLFDPSLRTYSYLLIATSVASCAFWVVVFRRRFGFRPIVERRAVRILKEGLASYGLWDHLNRMAVDTLLLADSAILGWFALGRVGEIAEYTISLRFSSMLFLIPKQLQRGLQLTLANCREHEKRVQAIHVFLKANFLASAGQFLLVVLAGGWMIRLLFGQEANGAVVRYAVIIAGGATLINLAWPFVSVVNNLTSLRLAFLRVFLPALVLGLAVYIFAAMRWGALGLAFGKVAANAALACGLVFFATRHYPIPLRFPILSEGERRFFEDLWRRR
jgi:hypothetical protein